MAKILVIHGAGMNMRGKSQLELFGPTTLAQYDEHLRRYAAELKVDLDIFHSNAEGEIIPENQVAGSEERFRLDGFVWYERS